jgi:hypothetical protein
MVLGLVIPANWLTGCVTVGCDPDDPHREDCLRYAPGDGKSGRSIPTPAVS